MKILQISCGFGYSSVYKDLFAVINQYGVYQEVYLPLHDNEAEYPIIVNDLPYRIYSNQVIRGYDKVLYFSKIIRMKKDVEKNFDLPSVSLIHAHSLFSDGGVAYEIYKESKIPYIVVVRNTDVNKYYKYGIHLRRYGEKILNNAEYVIFLSPMYKNKVLGKYISSKSYNSIKKKSIVIPNGINDYWIKNIGNPKVDLGFINNGKVNIISVGGINKNKNFLKVAEACKFLNDMHGLHIELTIVGKIDDESYYNSILSYPFVKYYSFQNKDKLLDLYKDNNIFVMPSIHETFGLVYLEAMSQGLPIIYSKGQGFDGQITEGKVGYSVNPESYTDIASKILKILENYNDLTINCIEYAQKFGWDNTADRITKIYKKSILGEK